MLSLEVRKRAGGAEVHRVDLPALTVGASSGNEVVVRARGVAGRHFRIMERDGGYYLDLYKGVEAVSVNGHEFTGGQISIGDRITIGEATLTVLAVRGRVTPVAEVPIVDTGTLLTVTTGPLTEVEYRALRLKAYRVCRRSTSPEELASELADFLDRELPPSEWAVGRWTGGAFRALSSTFRETPVVPPRLLQEIREGERLARVDTVTGMLSLVVEPDLEAEASGVAILVREDPRLAARAILFLEELVQLAGLAMRAGPLAPTLLPDFGPVEITAPTLAASEQAPAVGESEAVLRQTDDLKRIVEVVEREVIDRAMRRIEGNQSRGAALLNISRGSLIAKLKDYRIPDYRYLRRDRGRRG